MMTSSTRTDPQRRVDGRRAWRERNRNAVVDALLDLYMEGNMDPGAQAIAERSGVSRRSLFRYFDDMDDLCRVAIERHAERVGHLFEIERIGEGTLEDRIERLAGQRMRLYETIAPVRQLATVRAPFQPMIASRLAEADATLRTQVERHFAPELDRMQPDRRKAALAAADAIASFAAYNHMATSQHLPRREALETIRFTLDRLFNS